MMVDTLEMKYHLSAKDRQRAQHFLNDRSYVGQDADYRFLSNRYVLLALNVFLMLIVVQWIIQVLPLIFISGLLPILSPEYMVGNIVVLFAVYHLTQSAWGIVAKYRKRKKTSNVGVNCGEHHFSATPKGLTVNLAKCRIVYKWAALLDLIETNDMLLLLLAPRRAIAVPKNAFRSGAEEESFREFIRGHMTTS